MLARPTTSQLLLDCSAELRELLPSVGDEVTQARLAMVESVLRSAAVRAANEVAWMCEEIEPLRAYAAAVQQAAPGSADLDAAVAAAGPPAGLQLDAVVDAYVRASDALSRALEVAVATGDEPLVAEGVRLLDARVAHERAVRGGWSSSAGR